VQVLVAEHKVASVAAIQNFGSFVFASFAPIVTGWVVDTTHSFNLALVIAAGVTFAGALCYFFIVKTRIDNRQPDSLNDRPAGTRGRCLRRLLLFPRGDCSHSSAMIL
jgi:hypothetical protein